MFLRSAAMTAAMTMGGAAFLAGMVAGTGLAVAGVGAACLARRAMKRRGDWGRDRDESAAAPESSEPHPGVANPG